MLFDKDGKQIHPLVRPLRTRDTIPGAGDRGYRGDRMRKVRAVFLGLVLSVGIGSAVPTFAATVVGAGTQSCGQYLEARRDKDKNADATNRRAFAFASWLGGFLTVVNQEAVNKTGIDIVVGTDIDGVLAWLDKYCRENPLEMFANASWRLAGELLNRKAPTAK